MKLLTEVLEEGRLLQVLSVLLEASGTLVNESKYGCSILVSTTISLSDVIPAPSEISTSITEGQADDGTHDLSCGAMRMLEVQGDPVGLLPNCGEIGPLISDDWHASCFDRMSRAVGHGLSASDPE